MSYGQFAVILKILDEFYTMLSDLVYMGAFYD